MLIKEQSGNEAVLETVVNHSRRQINTHSKCMLLSAIEVCMGQNFTARTGPIRFWPGPFFPSNFWPSPLRSGPGLAPAR